MYKQKQNKLLYRSWFYGLCHKTNFFQLVRQMLGHLNDYTFLLYKIRVKDVKKTIKTHIKKLKDI